MKRKSIIILLFLMLFPLNIYAYSNNIVIGGETIGIEVHSDGIYVVGYYSVNDKYIAKDAGFMIGDIIKKVDDVKISNINSLSQIIKEAKKYKFTIMRNNKEKEIYLTLEKEDDLIKTGLYVKIK